jgi:pentatricopeptide repeat protein
MEGAMKLQDFLIPLLQSAKNHKTDVFTYSILLRGYATEGRFVNIINLFNFHVLDILIDVYDKCGTVDEAMLIFTEMREHGVSPDVFNYATVNLSEWRVGWFYGQIQSDVCSGDYNRMDPFIIFPDDIRRYSLSLLFVLLFNNKIY